MAMRWIGVEDRWPSRHRAVASAIPEGSSVIDLGCGAGGLRDHLPAGCSYVGVDLPDFDMDADRWPAGRYDVAVMAGVLEYAARPELALRRMRALAPLAIVTYVHGGRRDPDWNDLSRKDLRRLAERAGYRVEATGTWRTPLIRPQVVWVLA